MKQKLFCFGDEFTIQDDAGRDAFFVDGKVFSVGNKLSFQDMSGNEQAFIQQKLLSWTPTYEIYRNGELAAVVKKEAFTFFHTKFTIDIQGSDPFVVDGDILNHNYVFTCDGREIAQVSKQWFAISDSYGVDVADGRDDVLMLACTVVIDMVCHGDKKH